MQLVRDMENGTNQPVQTIDRTRRTLLIAGATTLAGGLLGAGATVSWNTFLGNTTKVVPFPLVVGGKLDKEAALLTKMYVLLLRNAGFKVTDRWRLGKNQEVFNAIRSADIDIYPEFLLTGLAWVDKKPSNNPQKNFELVKEEFDKRYRITWLNQATQLNDSYCFAMTEDKAMLLGVKSLSDVARIFQPSFKIAVAPDAIENALVPIQRAYGFTFAQENIIQRDEEGTFSAVERDEAQFNICISTDPLIKTRKFLRLLDDKKILQVDTPSPIVRNEVLAKAPEIATTLNALAPLLTIEVSTELQEKMSDYQDVEEIARTWLRSKNLLP